MDIAERRNQSRNQRNSSKSKIVVGSAISLQKLIIFWRFRNIRFDSIAVPILVET